MKDSPAAYDWAASRGSLWRDQLDAMEAMLAPVDAPLIAALALDAPCRIADIGCGGGGTSRALAAAAPAGSSVTGFDISPELVAAATARAGDVAGFALADAARYRPGQRFDRIASRFGVMFFDDEAAAFANLHDWLAPDGRIAFAVWGPGPEVRFMASAREAVGSVIDLPPGDPAAPGPCRYGDPARLFALLEAAGFRDAANGSWRGELPVGGGLGPEDAADFLLASSSTAAPLADAAPELRARARDRLIAVCGDYVRDGIVRMPVRVEIVTARA